MAGVLGSSCPKPLVSCPHLSSLVEKGQVQGSLGSISQDPWICGTPTQKQLLLLPFNIVLLRYSEHLLCTKYSTHNSQ